MIHGLILWVIALAIIIAAPAARQLESRRTVRHPIAHVLDQAFSETVAPPAPALDELVAQADAALDRDQLTRGVRAIRETYDGA